MFMQKYKEGTASTIGFVGGSIIGYLVDNFSRGMAIGLLIGAVFDYLVILRRERAQRPTGEEEDNYNEGKLVPTKKKPNDRKSD